MKEVIPDSEMCNFVEWYTRYLRCGWLLEDDDFRKAVKVGWDCCERFDDFVFWFARFMDSLKKDAEYLSKRVSLIRIKRWLETGEIEIKNGRFVKGKNYTENESLEARKGS